MITSSMMRSARDEFEKIAEEERESGAEQVARGKDLLSRSLAALISNGIGAHLTATDDMDATLARKMRDAASKEIPIEAVPGHNAYFVEKDWIPGKGEHIGIGTSVEKSPSILAHNLGHMEISRKPVGRLLRNKATFFAGMASPVIGAATGALSGLSDDERVQALGRWAPVIASAPRLAVEGGASLLGLRRMSREGATAGQLLRGVGTLLPAWGTHAANAGLGYAAANTTQGLVRKLREEERRLHEKDATNTAQV